MTLQNKNISHAIFFNPMRILICTILFFLFSNIIAYTTQDIRVPILVYHDLDPIKKGAMTISTQKFEQQIIWLKNNGYTIIPLMQLVDYLRGQTNSLPPKSVVITADDGRETVYRYMLPIVEKYHFPVTLFIYPSIISREPYALTWEQLKALQQTGLFTIESHTYGHVNFRQAKKNLSEIAYQKMMNRELMLSKNQLDQKLGIHVTLLAWPFGIYNHEVEEQAAKEGYVMAFSIGARHASRTKPVMAMPRYMIIEDQNMAVFAAIVKGRTQ